MVPFRSTTGLAVWSLMAVTLLAGCTPPVAPVASGPSRPALGQQAGPALTADELQTAMFGPPPRTRIDPLVRCWVNCPQAQRTSAVR